MRTHQYSLIFYGLQRNILGPAQGISPFKGFLLLGPHGHIFKELSDLWDTELAPLWLLPLSFYFLGACVQFLWLRKSGLSQQQWVRNRTEEEETPWWVFLESHNQTKGKKIVLSVKWNSMGAVRESLNLEKKKVVLLSSLRTFVFWSQIETKLPKSPHPKIYFCWFSPVGQD